eukprot:3183777-Amphidinium_carterae.1
MAVLRGAVVGHIHGVGVISMVERTLARAWSFLRPCCARSSLQGGRKEVGHGHCTLVTWHGREHGFKVRLAK